MINSLRRLMTRLARRPGARGGFARCLDVADLPGSTWQLTDQRTWHTGLSAAAEPWAAAAREAGSLTAWRWFSATDSSKSLWLQVVPLARIEDGQAALAAVSRGEGRKLRVKAAVVGTSEVLPTPSVPGATLVSATEQQTRSDTHANSSLVLRFVVGANLVVMTASTVGDDTPWAWGELLDLAAAQARKLTS